MIFVKYERSLYHSLQINLHKDKEKTNLIPIHKIAHSFFGYLDW